MNGRPSQVHLADRSFILDLAVNYGVDLGSESQRTVTIIELNPYIPSTSACLFDWREDVDLLMVRSEEGFAFRVVERASEEGLKFVSAAYRGMLRKWVDGEG